MNEPQTPAQGIMLFKKYKNFMMYSVPCDCGCDDKIGFDIEVDDDGMITSHFYATTKTNYWHQYFDVTYKEFWLLLGAKQLANSLFNRFNIVYKALFKGYVETETYIILSKQQTLNFADTLNKAVSEFENRPKP